MNFLFLIFLASYFITVPSGRKRNEKFICHTNNIFYFKGKKAIDDKPYSFCLNNLCSTNAQCNPTSSAYTCKCKNGYFGSGFSCVPTNCPPGTVQLGEACVQDKCTHCKPRFACRNENAGTPSATCKCKEGWSGNGKLCLPKKNVERSDIQAFAEPPTARPGTQAPAFYTEQYAQMLHDNLNLKKSQSSGELSG